MIKIITDTGADLSLEMFADNDITFIPIPVQFGGVTYKDQVDIHPKEFYSMLDNTKEMPSTSRIAPYEYEKLFEKYLSEGHEILCITFSSGLSAIYESAAMTAQNMETDKITVIDSKCASLGQGLVVLRAAELVKAGQSRQAIAADLIDYAGRMEHIFACGSLEMLKRGGRVTTMQAVLGTVLKVIPILQIDDGKIIPYENVRGSKRMIQFMLESMERRGGDIHEQVVGISHANDREMAAVLADSIREKFDPKRIVITEIGAAIGSHSGPQTLALFFQR